MNRKKIAMGIIKGSSAEERELHGQGFKTACTCAVLAFYGIEKKDFKFCQYVSDMVRHLNRSGLSARAMHTRAGIRGRAVNSLPKLVGPGFYLVQTNGHVCLAYVGNNGGLSFPVETNPISGEKNMRRILTLHRITNKRK